MARYIQIYRSFFKSSLARELEFRANFFAQILQNAMWIGFGLLVIMVIYSNVKSVAGWSFSESLVLLGTTSLVGAIQEAFTNSLLEIPEHVRKGTLDFVLTKPVDSQFWVSARRFNFNRLGAILGGLGFVIGGALTIPDPPGLLQMLGFLVLLACAVTLYYCLCLFFMTLAIWWVKVDNLWVLGEVVLSATRYPIDVFSDDIRRVMIFGVPLAFLCAMPTLQLVRGFDAAMIGLGLLWTGFALVAVRLFWRRALRSYSSASS